MALVLNGSNDTITGLQINSANIVDGSIVNADINSSAAIASSKISGSLGKILQMVTVSDSVRETTGSVSIINAATFYATPFAVTITPSATSSKILLMGHVMGESSLDDYLIVWGMERAISGGATTDIIAPAAGSRARCISVFPSGFYSAENLSTPSVFNFSGLVDSPNTTSAVTYTFSVAAPQNTSVGFYYNRTNRDSDSIHDERGLSWITAIEVGA